MLNKCVAQLDILNDYTYDKIIWCFQRQPQFYLDPCWLAKS